MGGRGMLRRAMGPRGIATLRNCWGIVLALKVIPISIHLQQQQSPKSVFNIRATIRPNPENLIRSTPKGPRTPPYVYLPIKATTLACPLPSLVEETPSNKANIYLGDLQTRRVLFSPSQTGPECAAAHSASAWRGSRASGVGTAAQA
jgi:hypothetical protein